MKKGYKIKRSRKINGKRRKNIYKAHPHPLSVILFIVVVGALLFVGISSYRPILNFLSGTLSGSEAPSTVEESSNPDSSERPQDTEPEPEPAPMPTVSGLHGVYLTHAVAANEAQLDTFLDALSGTGVNAVMLDIKDGQGRVLFQSKNAKALAYGVIAENAVDLAVIAQKLSQRDLQLVVRTSAFNDEAAARANVDMAVQYRGADYLWLDNSSAKGKPWLNPYSAEAKGYIQELAVEAVEAGAVMVVLQDVQFPPGSGSSLADFGQEAGGITRSQALSNFVREAAGAVQEAGAVLSVYLPATQVSVSDEVLYGGMPADMLGEHLALGAFPYLYTNNYSQDGLTLAQPAADPAATVKSVVSHTQSALSGRDPQPEIIAVVQGGTESAVNAVTYTKEQINAQVTSLSELGVENYIFYQTGSSYLLA